MSILLCGMTIEDIYGANVVDASASTSYYDSTWAPSYLVVPDDGYMSVGVEPQNDFWLAFNYRVQDSSNINADGDLLQIHSTDGGRIMFLDILDSAWRMYHCTDGVNWILTKDHRSYEHLANTVRVDIHVEYNIAASGTVTVTWYLDGNVRMLTTGTITGTTSDGVGQVRWSCFDNENTAYVSSIIIADEDTRGMVLTELTPDGAGNYTAWDGAYSDMKGAGRGSGIESNVNGDRESWSLAAFEGDTGAVGMRVVQSVHAYAGSSGVSKIDGFCRISSTDYDNGAGVVPNSPGVPTMFEWTENPATTAPWTVADLGTLESGVKAVT